MTGDDYRPSPAALELAHEKLTALLEEQTAYARHLDRKAMATLRASIAFSGVVAAVFYYIASQRGPSASRIVDTPFAGAALVFGVVSLTLSLAAMYHTKLTTELAAADIVSEAQYSRTELLVTVFETYPSYVERNRSRLNTDRTLLSAAHLTLALTVGSTVVTVVAYSAGWTGWLPGGPVYAFVGGVAVGGLASGTAVLYLSRRRA